MRDLTFGRFWVRLDVVLVIIVAGIVSGAVWAGALWMAILLHEVGHALAGYWASGRFSLTVQLTGGSIYIRRIPERGRQAIVLLAGPVAGVISVGLGWVLAARNFGTWLGMFGSALRDYGLLWSCFQLLPFPPMDGGILVQRVLFSWEGRAIRVWQISWAAGLAVVIGAVAIEPRLLEPAIWLTGMAVILGRSEAGYVHHLDAYTAWEQGHFKDVIRRVRGMPDYMVRDDKISLLELGIAAARELDDVRTVEDFASRLPAAHPTAVGAAEWLLMHERPFGARLAEQAFDALDAEMVSAREIDHERWGDMAFRLAIFEAQELKLESALGMLERAVDLGFDDVDRLEAEGAFGRLKERPRFQDVCARARKGAQDI